MMRSRSGFTLFELLISLFLLALVSAIVASIMGYSVRLLDRSDDVRERAEQMHHRTLLRQWIQRADPTEAMQFVGRPDSIIFHARSDNALAWRAESFIVELRTVSGRTELHLLDGEESLGQVLLLSEAELRLSYYGELAGEAGWHDGWTGQDSLPTLIRIAGANPLFWNDFVEMTRLSAE
ncbi:prepilin-type N-terminal cleavage/methylation domain-containing protein [Tateyamaria omphalii]|uniref:prepilin-type N-terminal cleavage/methylation domain-containing protein n=1 Tax=Tateyamaria omphalii TaxID=299262 RepID=UPI001C99AC6F|nr:prepilin-type N-terminal cleavage/methylation domain-containing protein [Tateyamaria omphalii]MBY5934925.1 prepilin-type N-terminal cleavage/methylation domain-containing protein [Tateyamaria omphalii]